MTVSEIYNLVQRLKTLITLPIVFQDIKLELLDAKTVSHDALWTSTTHHHPWFEFNYISEGKLYTTVNDTEFCALGGSSFLIPPGFPHSHTHYGSDFDNGFCLRWKISRASEKNIYYEKFARTLQTPRYCGFDANISLLDRCETHIETQLAFINWLVFLCEMNTESESEFSNQENGISSRVILYLSEYYDKVITVQDVASSLNMSYRSLARNFKNETGITVIEKLNEIRIAEAKKLLISTDLPLSEIAVKVGFANEYYFSNTFRQYSAATPSAFRKNNKQSK